MQELKQISDVQGLLTLFLSPGTLTRARKERERGEGNGRGNMQLATPFRLSPN